MNALPLLLMAALLLSGCGDEKSNESSGEQQVVHPRTVKITTAVSSARDLEIRESALGRIIDPVATTIGAEVPGRVISVQVQAGEAVARGQLLAVLDDSDTKAAVATTEAEVRRLQSEQQAQQNLVARYRSMIDKHYISPTLLEQAEAQLDVLQQREQAAQATLIQARNNLQRTRITAPVAGHIEQRMVAAGDYIGLGKPLFKVAAAQRLTVSIPLPETRAAHIQKGQTVRLRLPSGGQIVTATITDLTPMVGSSNAFEVRVDLEDNPGQWRPGGSVSAEIVTATHSGAVVVPEECIVLRPSGTVVYRIEDGKAQAVSVITGVHLQGFVEVSSGLDAGVVVAADGAGYLSDGAVVAVHNSEGVQP
ncbi:MAG: efflux RND transporter periplasmic adaptor subunit [Zetaproteobacteria bacterium CG12_big_fil_rev_8_21_14_0_65_54_13]|nr:MAG: efflux transporter periplasmic adaptor subunit [Zetaproteobacteria bacterium CG23_combo_of_CG06-09_8_20_14_all_54_7]PIW47037.1 MAG: efflux RND transporter periplasmic adaptor subunit [Zetaproteobacteria bacterium CG12_big_fil_rev_8_21_14_0_65_54_13]PIX53876.1 MAG: efflux RND transporter periplasmic adaptor subunit [Zetaproteobacteria bacterium CG_4_10_14_3_um_filter_54_28]PJA28601.1 MAG: efflux RND transporter periplasmic adaptor subunit [Zetaproteobacteria bacterium CG_4_9_14_3_um_filte